MMVSRQPTVLATILPKPLAGIDLTIGSVVVLILLLGMLLNESIFWQASTYLLNKKCALARDLFPELKWDIAANVDRILCSLTYRLQSMDLLP